MMQAKKVLVIEDNQENLKRIRNILEFRNWQIFGASSARADFKMAKNHCPDIILMGSHLSLADKIKTADRIKAEPSLKNIPLVYLTDGRDDPIEKKIFSYWDSCISTAIDSKLITETINRLLGDEEQTRQIPHHILRMQSQYYVSIFLINNPI
jgi:two-component system cell cycle response regulator DivK